MHPARIAELLQPFLSNCHSEPAKAGEEPAALPAAQLQSISTYIDLLLHWNARINLTAIRNEEEIVTRHFGESLFAASHLFPRVSSAFSAPSAVKGLDVDVDVDVAEARRPTAEPRVADLGSGAGFPGVPIKLWAPKISLTLIESNQKKATFLREIARALTLTSVNIQNVRAETLPLSTFDVVTLRAVDDMAAAIPAAIQLLNSNGWLAILTTHEDAPAIQAKASESAQLNWQIESQSANSSRVLLIGQRKTTI